MLTGEAIRNRVSTGRVHDPDGPQVRLPTALKPDAAPTRIALLRRLSESRTFALGNRSGALRAAQARSGRAFRADTRQRVVVKALVCRHRGAGAGRGAALAAHVAYLGRSGAGAEGARPAFFDREAADTDPRAATMGWSADRHHFRFIISPEHGDRIRDLPDYVRDVMRRVAADLGEPSLAWVGTCHYDTGRPHAHVLVRGRRGDGRDLVIPRAYMAHGFRARAAEAAQERLGDLSRHAAERRIWKETLADRFTALDRRLLGASDVDRMVSDGVGGNDAWAALTRGRLRHLERLGLAVRAGRRYRLDAALEVRLRTLQTNRDVIRTLNQRRLEGALDVRTLGHASVEGVVVKRGCHDEAGAAPWVLVRDRAGVEHYGRLPPGVEAPRPGQSILLAPAQRDLAIASAAKPGLER